MSVTGHLVSYEEQEDYAPSWLNNCFEKPYFPEGIAKQIKYVNEHSKTIDRFFTSVCLMCGQNHGAAVCTNMNAKEWFRIDL